MIHAILYCDEVDSTKLSARDRKKLSGTALKKRHLPRILDKLNKVIEPIYFARVGRYNNRPIFYAIFSRSRQLKKVKEYLVTNTNVEVVWGDTNEAAWKAFYKNKRTYAENTLLYPIVSGTGEKKTVKHVTLADAKAKYNITKPEINKIIYPAGSKLLGVD